MLSITVETVEIFVANVEADSFLLEWKVWFAEARTRDLLLFGFRSKEKKPVCLCHRALCSCGRLGFVISIVVPFNPQQKQKVQNRRIAQAEAENRAGVGAATSTTLQTQ